MNRSATRPVLRRCVACRALRDRGELWRVIRLAEGGLALDRGMGRSAYLCISRDCLEEARRRKRLGLDGHQSRLDEQVAAYQGAVQVDTERD